MAWYGQWLSEALEQVAPGRAVVVGHSLGGAIALTCASPLIAGRVLVSPAGLTRLRVSLPVLAATLPWLARPSVPRAERLLRLMMAPGALVPDELSEWMAVVARCCRSSLAPSPLPSGVLADRRTVACLVATGRHDGFLSPWSLGPAVQRQLGIYPQIVDGAGHLLLEEAPGRIAGLVEELRSGARKA